jgi:DHA3 family macrolide efflux protein-like MFS transporter
MAQPLMDFKAWRALWKTRSYFRLWLAQAVSGLGNRVHGIALLAYVYALTGKGLDLGVLMLVMGAASLIASPIAGVLADRYNPRRIMIIADSARFALVLLLPFTTALWQIYTLAFFLAIGQAAYMPSVFSLIPRLVGRSNLITANSLSATTQNVLTIVGPALGGFLVAQIGPAASAWLVGQGVPGWLPIEHFGVTIAFFFDSATFLFSVIMLTTIGRLPNRGEITADAAADGVEELDDSRYQATGFFREMWQGIRMQYEDPVLRFLLLVFIALIFFTSCLNPLFIVLSDQVLGVGTAGFGMLLSALGVGGIVGGLIYGSIGSRFGKLQTVINLLFLDAVMIVVMGLTPWFWVAMGVFFVFGMIGTAFQVSVITLLQERIPDKLRGRAMGTISVAFEPVSMASMGLGGAISDVVGVQLLFVGSGIAEFAVAVVARLTKSFRKFQKL